MKKDNNAIAITAIISVVILIVALVALFSFGGSSSNYTEDSVTVQGLSTVKAMPDLISINFNIETKANTSTEAKDANSEILNDLIDALIAQGFERKDIVTENFNVYQDYTWEESGRKDNGFIANHYVVVEVSSNETDKLGSIVDAGVNAGALVGSIDFKLSQELQNEYKAQAMKLAAADAKIKAESVAEGFDQEVGKLVNVQVNDFGYYPWNVYSRGYGVAEDAAMIKEVASNIQPGEKEVTASVSATYKLR
jgi:hypothetical protein